ncbi:aminotransferase class V-fold PLP-dependent enzyme [Streptomyces sp. WMMB 322]|uniref:pyridoxal phosphate-dependent decarboxylase family protein n=1 Tax=Streptomyces sp. WMMB 322 TaxID=1286821 RepID=UPI000823869B|nr:aminotransferase class V-fold PLP-dependent enzyme [Streptomyces sp. WMMB 322]SCK23709.1 L-2,4-diaminobutyrate decarboxylase [Streptomyces sp. WMMB 322]
MPLPPSSGPTDGAIAPPLAGGTEGAAALRPLAGAVIDALEEGALRRCGPLPGGGPRRVAAGVAEVLRSGVIPERGTGAREALGSLVRLLAEGAADPADPLCAAHLHCPPLAVAAAAELGASALNPSLDSWDQAPAASELEAWTCRALARLVYHDGSGGDGGPCGDGAAGGRDAGPDALVTTGGTESNQLGLLLARERLGPDVRVLCGANAHHSVHRAAWLLGLPEPVRVPAPGGALDPGALRATLAAQGRDTPVLVVATAGTTDAGAVDPLGELAEAAREFGARLHVDAAYGGMLLFSRRLRPLLAGLERADSVTLDLHKLGWQPVAAGIFVVPDGRDLSPLGHRADYLNADDDCDAGLPDLLGRSLRTTRRADVLKVAVTLRALGRSGLGELVERTCAVADSLAQLIDADPGLELFTRPELSTVLFRPVGADGATVASVRRRLMSEGTALLGRAGIGACSSGDGGGTGREGLWLKATLLNPYARSSDLESLLKLVRDALPATGRSSAGPTGRSPAGPTGRSPAGPGAVPASAPSEAVVAPALAEAGPASPATAAGSASLWPPRRPASVDSSTSTSTARSHRS